MSAYHVDWDHDPTSNDCQYQKDVSTHLREPHKDRCVQANLLHQCLLRGVQDRLQPCQKSFANRGWGMFFVRMFETGSVNHDIVGPYEAENEGDDKRKTQGRSEGG